MNRDEEVADEDVALAIDPGRSKCGIAVVRRDGAILHRDIIASECLMDTVRLLIAAHAPCALLIGSGTGSKPLLSALEQANLDLPLMLVDEAYTSEEARRRYVASHPSRGLQRLLPRSLRTPDRPYDDYVAVILAERWWQQRTTPQPPPS